MADKSEPQRFGKCLVEREIGRGARSLVYLAWHEGLQIPVAVKVMGRGGAADEEQFSERFMREARIAAQLSHTNIVRVYDCGETDDSYYLVLEYIEGESCKDRMMRSGSFDWLAASRIVRAVADGLKYASAKGIIHRDLKPENIMIDKEGNARIADLGLAKEVAQTAASATADGDVLGTPYYMSPEQVRQPGDVDFRSDIYSLGATLYHMATGEVPFEAPTPFEIMTMHLNEPVTPPQVKRPDLPRPLCDVIMRCMAKEPQSRYQSYGDLMRDLDSLSFTTSQSTSGVMEAVEQTLDEALDEGPAVGSSAHAAVSPVIAAVRPVLPTQLRTTASHVQAKVAGAAAAMAYAVAIVGVYEVVIGDSPSLPRTLAAIASVLLLVALASGWGYFVLRLGPARGERERAVETDERVAAALGRACRRLGLPTPRVFLVASRDAEYHAYSFGSRKATVYLPENVFAASDLTDEEIEAVLIQYVAAVYSGDSAIRTVLAVPTGLLSLGAALARRATGILRSGTARGRLRAAYAVTALGMVAMCAVIALLFVALSWKGLLLGVVAFGALLLVAVFERNSQLAADAFACQVLGTRETVQSLIVLAGLTSVERYQLLYESIGPDMASRPLGAVPTRDERRHIVESVLARFGTVPHSLGTLEMARTLYSRVPSAADRLNRLAGVGPGGTPVIGAANLAKSVYARLVGLPSDEPVELADLADTRPYALAGALAGAISVLAMALLVWRFPAAAYESFLAVVALAGIALGVGSTHRAARSGANTGKMGWALVTCAVTLTATTMLGFCLTGQDTLARLSLQFPITFALTLVLAAFGSAIVVRFGPPVARRTRRPHFDGRGGTAQTLTIPLEAKKQAPKPAAQRDAGGAKRHRAEPGPEGVSTADGAGADDDGAS